MADDIYINTGTTFQQQYTARVPANAQQPVSGQVPARQPANSQNPFTYANRNPFTYRNPVVNQSPYIANAQQTYPYPANAQTPFIANAQQTYPYIASDRQPAIYQHPFTYARQAQTPAIYQHPTTYATQGRTPFTYQNRQPSTYSNRQPAIYQNPYPYIANARQPSSYQLRTPSTYRNPLIGRTPYPYIANNQTPYIANAQTPYPYIANAQNTANSQTPYPYIANKTGTTPANGRTPYIFAGDTTHESALRSAFETEGPGNVATDAQIDLFVKYNGNNIEVWGKFSGSDTSAAPPANHPDLAYTLCYVVEPDWVNATGYTVKYSIVAQGNADINGNIGTTASAIPTDNSRTIQFEVSTTAGFGGFSAVIVNTSISIILEKTGYTTWTYNPTLFLRCIATDTNQ